MPTPIQSGRLPIYRQDYVDHPQSGTTLVELMISITLGMLIVLAVTALLLSVKSAQATHNDMAVLNDSALFALNNIARSVKQAGYVNYDRADAPNPAPENKVPGIMGLDASAVKATSYGIDNPTQSANHGSDVLAVRYSGSGIGNADNTIVNCAGFGVSAADTDGGWSIYYVANDAGGEPNLYCKYKDRQFTAQSIVQGVESFQVLYGLDTSSPPNGVSNQFMSATEINALDAGIPAAELIKTSHWKKITALKIAILMRGNLNNSLALAPETYYLFGPAYSQSNGSADNGTKISPADFAADQKLRIRKVTSMLIQLRNPLQ